MPYLITPFIAECRKRQPNLQIDAREDFRNELVRAVVEGELDLAVVPLPVKDHRISIEPLLTEPLLLVVGKNHPIASRTEINIKDLAEETFISLGDLSALAAQTRVFLAIITSSLESATAVPKSPHSSSSFQWTRDFDSAPARSPARRSRSPHLSANYRHSTHSRAGGYSSSPTLSKPRRRTIPDALPRHAKRTRIPAPRAVGRFESGGYASRVTLRDKGATYKTHLCHPPA